jgi:hypothetical protein
MLDSPASEPEDKFVCDCEEWMRSACAAEPFHKEHQDKRYCVLHYPNNKSGFGERSTGNPRAANSIFAEFGFTAPARHPSQIHALKKR